MRHSTKAEEIDGTVGKPRTVNTPARETRVTLERKMGEGVSRVLPVSRTPLTASNRTVQRGAHGVGVEENKPPKAKRWNYAELLLSSQPAQGGAAAFVEEGFKESIGVH